MNNEPLKSIRKCAVCGKSFIIHRGAGWLYKKIRKGKTIYFCSYKCMRAFDAKHDGKRPAAVKVDEETAAPKEPVSRAVLAKALAKEIQRGGSVIAYMKAEGYKNPWEAYNAVRHYAETKMPELAEAQKDEEQGSQEKIEAVSVQTGEQFMKQLLHMYSREDLLLIVDKAALDCQKDQRLITMSSSGVKAAMLQNATVAAENVGIMKLRKQIRKMLGAEDDG